MTGISIDHEDDAAPRSDIEPIMRTVPSPQAPTVNAAPCDACGYDRRGLPAAHPCPECGYQPDALDAAQRDHRRSHARLMAAGLVMLLWCSLPAITVILYSPFRGGIGGTLPALNFPGPKLWAMPLLQRAIGNQAGQAGVDGTRTAMISLLAIWLITVAPRNREIDVSPKLRLTTRWVATITFGLGAGLLLASGGIWPGERFPYWLVLGGGIELPVAALLYAYLARVGRSMLPSRALHGTLNALVWIVPILIAGCISLFIIDPTSADYVSLSHRKVAFTVTEHRVLSGAIGVMLMTSGVIATTAIMRLAFGLSSIGFPRARRVWTLAGLALRNGRKSVRTIDPSRLRAAKIAAGLFIWILATLACVDATGNLGARKGVGGNLPFFNYIGPKAAAVPIILGFGGRWTRWYAMPGVHAVLLNLLAIALITTPAVRDRAENENRAERRSRQLAMLARWLPVLAAGCIFGACQGWRFDSEGYTSSYFGTTSGSTTEFAAAAIVLCELPATVLLYTVLARLSHTLNLHHIARRLRVITFIVVGLMLIALVSFIASRWFLDDRQNAFTLICSGVYGAISTATGLAATISMVVMAMTLIREHVFHEVPRTLAPISGVGETPTPLVRNGRLAATM